MQTLLPILLVACTVLTPALHAQDSSPEATEALHQKLARQAQTITDLQGRLTACESDGNDNDNPTLSNRYSFQPPAAPAPRRPVGVYQQPAEPKLTCADYSAHYFSRHPAMAAVCGANARATPAEDATLQPSPTTPLPQHP